MNKKAVCTRLLAVLALVFFPAMAAAQEMKTIQLPKPQTEGGKPLMQALKERASARAFAPDKLPTQVLSNLLWAACGINRPESGKRTAPSAHNWQEIDIYVAREDGLFLYDAKANALKQMLAEDIRAKTGVQKFVKDAPINVIFVADLSRMGDVSAEDKIFYPAADTGFISQNVYLSCASEGLVTVVRRWIDRPALAKAMHLGPNQEVVLAQTVGYPKVTSD